MKSEDKATKTIASHSTKDEFNSKINSPIKYVKKSTLPAKEEFKSEAEATSSSKKKVGSATFVKNENVITEKDYESSSSSSSWVRTSNFKKFAENEHDSHPETEVKYLEHKFIQCNVLKLDQKIEAVLP